jgi:UDP-3-O-[3-hydroxymyristoyl] glucosamine N-acyltransferase
MTLRELADRLNAELIGAAGHEQVRGIRSLDDAAPGCVVFAENARHLTLAESGPALAVIAGPESRESSKPLLIVADPRLGFARAIAAMHPPSRVAPGVHPSALIGEGVELAEGVAIGAYAAVGSGSRIGRGTQVHDLASVGRSVTVGDDCVVFPHVVLSDGVELGSRVVVHPGAIVGSAGFGYVWDGERHVWMPHIGTVVIEDDVDIGANATIDRGTTGATRIRKGTKIDNLVQVAHNTMIGENCLLAGQVGISGSVTLEDRVTLAGQAGVSDHVRMGAGSVGAAGADIIRDVAAGDVVLGRPARPIKQQLRIDAAAARLPDMLRELRALRERVAELEKLLGKGDR